MAGGLVDSVCVSGRLVVNPVGYLCSGSGWGSHLSGHSGNVYYRYRERDNDFLRKCTYNRRIQPF
jgi:hypothetical protein